jgi:hypothetical protein
VTYYCYHPNEEKNLQTAWHDTWRENEGFNRSLGGDNIIAVYSFFRLIIENNASTAITALLAAVLLQILGCASSTNRTGSSSSGRSGHY